MAGKGTISEMAAALQRASRLLLVAHLSPDGDSLGSLLALGQALDDGRREIVVFVPDGVPLKYRFLPGWQTVTVDPDRLPLDPGTVVLLDCGEWQRTGLPERYLAYPSLNIDHHRTSIGVADVNLIDSQAAATGELIHRVLKQAAIPIDAAVATCLYTAVVSDTGWFRFSNASPEIHLLAAELLQLGADRELVNDWLSTMPRTYLQALTLVLERLTVFCDDQASISWLSFADLQSIGVAPTEMEGLIDYPRALPGVQVAALLVETAPNTQKVSFRSRAPIDVSRLAGEFGGGGHARAAGCTLSNEDIPHSLALIRAAMERGLRGDAS